MTLALILRGATVAGEAASLAPRVLPIVARTAASVERVVASSARAARGIRALNLRSILNMGVNALTALTIADFLIGTVKDVVAGIGGSEEVQDEVAKAIVDTLGAAASRRQAMSAPLGVVDFTGWNQLLGDAAAAAVGKLNDEADAKFVHALVKLVSDQAAAMGAEARPTLDRASSELIVAFRACGVRIAPRSTEDLVELLDALDSLRLASASHKELATLDG